MGFSNRHCQGGAVNFAGRSMHDPLRTVLPRRLENVQGTEHICFDIGLRCDVRIGYRDQCREVKNVFPAVHEPAHKSCIPNVTTNEIDFAADRLGEIVQPTIAIERIVLRESSNFGSGRNQSFRQVRTDEAICSSDEDFGATIAHSHRCPPYFPLASTWGPSAVSAYLPSVIVQTARRIQPRSETSVRREK